MLYDRVLRPAEVGVTRAVENEDDNVSWERGLKVEGYAYYPTQVSPQKKVLLYGMFFSREVNLNLLLDAQ